MDKTKKKTTARAKAWKCVRFDDKKGVVTRFNKTNFQDELMREFYYFCVKYVEQLARGCPPTSVAERKRFQEFRRVLEGRKLKALPEGYQSFSPEKKKESVQKLVEELYDEALPCFGVNKVSHNLGQGVDIQVKDPGQTQIEEGLAAAPNPDLGSTLSNDASFLAAAAMSQWPVQGVDTQADYPDDMQVSEGSARQFDATVREDVDMKVNNPGQNQVEEVQPVAVPIADFGNIFSNDASLQTVGGNQRDNSQDRHSVPTEDFFPTSGGFEFPPEMSPGKIPEVEVSENPFDPERNLFGICSGWLKDAFQNLPTTHSKSLYQEELYPKLEDFSADEAVTNMSSKEESLSPADQELLSNFVSSVQP